jgi:hypothetical protein
MKMLWYKYWLDLRWGLVTILVALSVVSAGTVLWGPADAPRWLASIQRHGHFEQVVPDVGAALNTYQGYIWARWFREELLALWPTLAMVMGVSLMAMLMSVQFGSGMTACAYTLSLPITRRRLVAAGTVFIVVGLALVSIVPSLLLPVVSSLRGQSYPVTDALVHAFLMIAGGMVFFSFSFLLTAIVKNGWIVIIGGPIGHFILQQVFRRMDERPWWGHLYSIMSGESYVLNGEIPWVGLLISVTLAATMFYFSTRLFERRDF